MTCVLRDNVETRHRNWKHSARITSSPVIHVIPTRHITIPLAPHYQQVFILRKDEAGDFILLCWLLKSWKYVFFHFKQTWPCHHHHLCACHHNPLKFLSPPLRSFVKDVKAARLLCMIAPWGGRGLTLPLLSMNSSFFIWTHQNGSLHIFTKDWNIYFA